MSLQVRKINISRILPLLFIFIFCLPACVHAMEISSPFGYRIHPTYGDYRFHNGVDVAADFGVAIPAVKAGDVVDGGYGYNGGYGNYVVIKHADGSGQTTYAHCQDLFVSVGQQVAQGQVIATIGSTGRSTGPHLHFGWMVDGNWVDPLPLLMAAGWDLNYNSFPTGSDAPWMDDDISPWKFGDFYDIAKQIRVLLEDFSEQCTKGLSFIIKDAASLLTILMIIDLALTVVLKFAEDDWLNILCRKFLQYGFVIILLNNWTYFCNVFVMDSFTQAGATVGGGGDYIADNFSDPSKIVQKGVSLATPAFNYISTFSGLKLMFNLHRVLIALVLAMLIIACFLVIGLQFFLTYLEFYITCTLSVVSVPFGVTKYTRFLGEKSVGAVFSSGIKVMVMTFLVAQVVTTVKDVPNITYDMIEYLRIFASSAVLVFSVLTVKSITNLLIGGGPSLKLK